MGILMIALGRLTVSPEPTKELIKDYWLFSEYYCPTEFNKDNVGFNPWFFDKDCKLVSLGGKMCEPDVWYRELKEKFFEKRGFQLLGDPKLVFEGDVDVDIRRLEYDRVMERFDTRKILEQRFLSDEIRDESDVDDE
ncbi:MAG: hypothetical protein J5715_05905 [Clostridiales bacterium]|nr:hypothetical protein [Clostridiales bacterium]MBO4579670.1 hypothetical protein [Clostridiales bacterium]